MGDLDAGVFEIAQEDVDRDSRYSCATSSAGSRRSRSKPACRRPSASSHSRKMPHMWRPFYELADETVAAGGKMLVQGTSRWISTLLSFESTHALRQGAGMARYAQAAAGRTGSRAAESRDAPPSWSKLRAST